MRWLLPVMIVSLAFTSAGCEVKVQEKPEPVIKRDRKVDVDVNAPGVDVKINKD